jgi:hypothetical protein
MITLLKVEWLKIKNYLPLSGTLRILKFLSQTVYSLYDNLKKGLYFIIE